MKTSFVRGLGFAFALLISTSAAHAHPGHDDHELTWDFSHLVAHPLATAGWLALLVVGIVAVRHVLCRSKRP